MKAKVGRLLPFRFLERYSGTIGTGTYNNFESLLTGVLQPPGHLPEERADIPLSKLFFGRGRKFLRGFTKMLPYNITPDEVKNWITGIVPNMQWGQGGDYYQGLGHAPYRTDEHPSFSFNAEIGAWNDKATGEKGGIKDFCQKMGIPTPWNGKGGNDGVNLQAKATQIIYPYIDETENLIYQVVRTDKPGQGKKIYQRKPDGNGGWINSIKGVKLIPYRLPEMIQSLSNGNKTLFISEGEKCVDLLINNNYTAICNSGGAGKWGKMDEYFYNFIPIDTEIIILPDGDEPGQKHAEDIAKRFYDKGYRKIKIINLGYEIKKEHGDDIYDWCIRDKHQKDELEKLTIETPYYAPSQTSPYYALSQIFPSNQNAQNEDEYEDLEEFPFPIEAMPKNLTLLINKISKMVGCPVDMPSAFLLPTLGSAIGNFVKLQVCPGWEEKANLWVCVIAPSGVGKSPVLKIIKKPFDDKEKEEKISKDREKENNKKIWKDYEKRKKIFLKENKKKKDFPEPEPEKITSKTKYLLNDMTREALNSVLSINQRGILIPLDELTSWLNSMNQYKGGKGNDREFYLSLFGRDSIYSARKGSGDRGGTELIDIFDPFVNIMGGIQPCKLYLLIGDKPGESTDGLSQRFLFSYPDYCPNFSEELNGIPENLIINYKNLIYKLIEYGDPKYGEKVFKLTPEAEKLWISLKIEFEREKWFGNLINVLAETWAKMPTQTLRIALILQVVNNVSEEKAEFEITLETMEKAIELIGYFKTHAKKVYGEAMKMKGDGQEKEENNNFKKIINIIRNSSKGKLTLREIQQQTKLKPSQYIQSILNKMIEEKMLYKESKGKTEVYGLGEISLKIVI